jgi:serine/threonine-protein kinase
MLSPSDKAFSQIALATLMAKAEDVQRCYEILEQDESSGKPRRALPDLMVEMGFLTAPQVQTLIEEQERRAAAKLLGPFQLLARIGDGGMATVYRARLPENGTEVALKVLSPKLSSDPSFVARFRKEASFGMQLSHPNLVRTLAFGDDRGYHFIALELVDGGDLRQRLGVSRSLGEKEALQIARDVARALQHAHEKGLVHRDVKPSNIMFARDGAVKLSDFGLVKSSDPEASHLTITGASLGTPHYISPEQASGDAEVDIRADIYSLGCTLYRMVTGRTPFDAPSPIAIIQKHLNEKLTPPDEINPALSEGCVLVIEKMLAKERNDRYPTPADLILDIESVLDSGIAPRARIEEQRTTVNVSVRRRGARRHEIALRRLATRRARVRGRFARAGVTVGFVAVLVVIIAIAAFRPTTPAPLDLTEAERLLREDKPDAALARFKQALLLRPDSAQAAMGAKEAERKVEEKRLIARERVAPSAFEDLVDLADGWWSLAERDPSPAFKRFRSRAWEWYARALPFAGDDSRRRIVERLEEAVRQGAARPTLDLMKEVHPKRDSLVGTWVASPQGLSPRRGAPEDDPLLSQLRVPMAPPAEYDLRITVEDAGEAMRVDLLLPCGEAACVVTIDGWGGVTSGISLLDGLQGSANDTTHRGQAFPSSGSTEIVCFVRRNAVFVEVGNRRILNWVGDVKRLSVPVFAWRPDRKDCPVVGAWKPFRILTMELVPISDEAKRIR